jgi:tetratricopeptide (TPR) repeat protein
MRTSEQINTFWGVARESSADGERLRRRMGALAAMSLLVCGFLLAIGLGVLVFAFLAGVLISIGAIGFAAVWPQVRVLLGGWIRLLRLHGRRVRAFLVPLWRKARGSSAIAFAAARRHASALARSGLESGSRVGRRLAQGARATAIRFAPRPARIETQRYALRLNAAGTQHRRDGLYDQAVDCHRRALEILRALDDRRAVALTQSNLALALSHAGDDAWATALFEEAAATLGELGDEEHEAQIMANLGVAHRRHGRPQEADNVLQLALTKLNPDSSAYHTIEAELRRAS